MSLASIGCLGLILALLGAMIVGPLLLITGTEVQPQPIEQFDYSGSDGIMITPLIATPWEGFPSPTFTPMPTATLASSQ